MIKIAILGAGISGLSLAWFLNKQAPAVFDISIFDSRPRVGGWLYTVEQNGQLFECGPRGLRIAASGQYVLEMIDDLGIAGDVIFASQASKNRYLVHKGQLERVPKSPISLVTSSFGRMCFKACIKDIFTAKGGVEDESIASFCRRRFGKEATRKCIDPFVAGIYGANPDFLSIQTCFPSLYEKEQRYGSVVIGSLASALFSKKTIQKHPSTTISFKEGVGYLPKVLASQLSAKFYLNTPVQAIREEKDHVVIHTAEQTHAFDFLVSTIQPQTFTDLLSDTDPLKQWIPHVPMTSITVVSAGFYDLKRLPPSFGFLCPSHEEGKLLGIVFDSQVFPEHNQRLQTRLSFMIGGQRDPNVSCLSDEDLLFLARQAAAKYLDITDSFDDVVISRANQAVARYPVGYMKKLKVFEEQLKERRIRVAGAAFYGVSVGDCISSSARIGSEIIQGLQKSGSISIPKQM